ncbi:MAG: putative DNA-binding domain-containing protein [Rubrivivax sp.]
MSAADIAKETLRQQMLLRALWRDARPGVVAGWLRDGPRFERGLQAYQAHGGALAERALAAAYPTVQQLLGDEAFAALARVFWRADAPQQGDIATWGAALPAFVAGDAQLADEPYLADVARLEWAVHTAERAADGAAPVGLQHLADGDPALLRLRLQPGTALLVSPHPVATIWQAHRSTAADRFAPVQAAFAAGLGDNTWVRRRGWVAEVLVVDAATARFVAALLAGEPLAAALQAAGDGFNFQSWLLEALQAGAVAAVEETLR